MKKQFAYRTTHNDGVFRVYTASDARAAPEGAASSLAFRMHTAAAASSGDYRRVALYGTDVLIAAKSRRTCRPWPSVPMDG